MKRFLSEYLPAWILLIIFGGVVIHAPLTVYFGSHWPEAALMMKAWKELLMVVAGILIAWRYCMKTSLRSLGKDWVVLLAIGYIVLHGVVAILARDMSLQSTIAGLMIDLRYVAYFLLVYLFLTLYPSYRSSFMNVGMIGAIIVLSFALLQLVLPRDFLGYLGYSNTTIKPYILLDENPAFVRYGSTLRGPNPLGAYAMVVFACVIAAIATFGTRLRTQKRWYMWVGALAATLVSAWISYSRSAWLGLAAALGIITIVKWGRRLTRRQSLVVLLIIVIGSIGISVVKSTTFFQNIILHDNPTTGAVITSDQGHALSLKNGLLRMAQQPFGAGVGSTGSASLLGPTPLIIENQFLMIAHEAGWLGLALFVALWLVILLRLWALRADWFALGVFASGIGLIIISLFWPVLTDDTVSIVWWGLAAIALTTKQHTRGGNRGTTSNQKAKRIA